MAKKILLAAINSQYIHTNPAIRSLMQCVRATSLDAAANVSVSEWSINLPLKHILKEILENKPQIIAFSVYIWNVEFISRLVDDILLLMPQVRIFLGGPEPTNHPDDIFVQFPGIEGLFIGEGEEIWREFLLAVNNDLPLEDIPGVLLRGKEQQFRPAARPDLAQIPFLYTKDILEYYAQTHRVIYYESSRGCPYRCKFCASATEPLRERPLELVLAEMEELAQTSCQVKFVDRTFNANPQRACTIVQKALSLYREGLSWHFELSPYGLAPELIAIFNQAPGGYFHLEAGVQSLNGLVLETIGRHGNWNKAQSAICDIMAPDNCHLHLDLIAGLPKETPETFAQAVDTLHQLAPHYLQLGFLKILPGSLLEKEAAEHGLIYSRRPPYQILSTPTMSAEYLIELDQAEHMLNAFYNNRHFRQTLHYAGGNWPGGALELYYALARLLKQHHGGMSLIKKAEALAEILLPLDQELYSDLLRLDWMLYGDGQKLPACLRKPDDAKDELTFAFTWEMDKQGLAIKKAGESRIRFTKDEHKYASEAAIINSVN